MAQGGEAAVRPRVALVAHEIHDHGGMERAFAELIRHAGDEVDFVVVAARLAPDLRPLVRWVRIAAPLRPATFRFAAFYLAAGAVLPRLQVDIVHTLGAIVATPPDLATVQFCHAGFAEVLKHERSEPGSAVRRLNRALHRRMALMAEQRCFRRDSGPLLAAVSEGVEQEVQRHYPHARTCVTPNAVDVDRFRPDSNARETVRREELRVGDEAFVSAFVGGDWHRKGLHIAIDGLGLAQERTGVELHLAVVGEGDVEEYRHRAARAGLHRRVHFLGRRHDAQRVLQAADAFVFPTSYETFSLAAYEAAATQLPLIATTVSGIEDLLADGQAGFAVDPDAGAVSDALVALLQTEDRGRAMGAHGRSLAAEYTWGRSAGSVLRAYEALLRDRQAKGSTTSLA